MTQSSRSRRKNCKSNNKTCRGFVPSCQPFGPIGPKTWHWRPSPWSQLRDHCNMMDWWAWIFQNLLFGLARVLLGSLARSDWSTWIPQRPPKYSTWSSWLRMHLSNRNNKNQALFHFRWLQNVAYYSTIKLLEYKPEQTPFEQKWKAALGRQHLFDPSHTKVFWNQGFDIPLLRTEDTPLCSAPVSVMKAKVVSLNCSNVNTPQIESQKVWPLLLSSKYCVTFEWAAELQTQTLVVVTKGWLNLPLSREYDTNPVCFLQSHKIWRIKVARHSLQRANLNPDLIHSTLCLNVDMNVERKITDDREQRQLQIQHLNLLIGTTVCQ